MGVPTGSLPLHLTKRKWQPSDSQVAARVRIHESALAQLSECTSTVVDVHVHSRVDGSRGMERRTFQVRPPVVRHLISTLLMDWRYRICEVNVVNHYA